MTKYHVVAFDPGETTGYASAIVTIDDTIRIVLVTACEIRNFKDFANVFEYGDLQNAPDVVIIERFNLFPDKAQAQIGSTFVVAEMIGIIKYTLFKYDQREAISQTPHQKSMIDTAMLKQFVGQLPQSEHIRDAIRHIVYWAVGKRYGK